MEEWQSGWMHQSWKLARMKVLREFESHLFRQNIKWKGAQLPFFNLETGCQANWSASHIQAELVAEYKTYPAEYGIRCTSIQLDASSERRQRAKSKRST